MKGHEEIEKKKVEKINRWIEQHKEMPYLIGFKNFMGRTAANTKYDYIRYATNFMDWCKKDVSQVNLDDYTEYMSLFENKCSSYQISLYSALKKFADYLYASEKNSTDPMRYVQRPKFKESIETIQKRDNGWLDKKEINKYIHTVEQGARSKRAKNRQENWKERDMLIILLFLNTGIRCTALCKLDVDSIDIENQKLIVIDKGDKIKEFDLSDELMSYVIQWLNKRTELLNGKTEDALFISNRRERINYQTVFVLVKKYAENIDGKQISPHKLRATFGTTLYDATKDVYFVQEMMGHSNPKTTEMYIRGQKNINSQKAAQIMSKITIK